MITCSTARIAQLLGIIFFFLFQFFALQVLYPTNSKGEICGRGRYTSRPYLLFFDLTKCLNPAVLSLGCPTTQVCVQNCPTEKYSGYAMALSMPAPMQGK